MKNIALSFITFFAPLFALSAHAAVTIEHWTAPSGARVYFVPAGSLPMVDIQIDIAAGGLYAAPDLAGVAGLTHGLLDAGAGELNEEQIAERLVDTGAQLGGQVDADRASLHLRTLTSPKEMSAALALLKTVLTQPTFPAEVLEREKIRAIAAIRDAQTRPDAIAGRRFAAAIYPSHPYGVQPDVDSVARLTRDDLQRFYRARYQSRNTSVSIVGQITRAQAEALADDLTAPLAITDRRAPMPVPEVTMPAAQTLRIAHPATQSHIVMGLPAVERGHPDFFALLVGNYSFGGGGFVSRLMKEVREKRGYAYSVGSSFSPRKLAGPFQISLQTQRTQADAALAVVGDELKKFLRDGPTAKELAAAKKNLIDGLALGLDSNAKLLGYVSVIGFFGLPLSYLDDFPQRVAAVTPAQVQAAFARHVRPEHLVTVIVGTDE
jgi:zinc protease